MDDLDDFQLDQQSASSHDKDSSDTTSTTRPSTLKIVTAANNDTGNENVPMITVQDCDDNPSPPLEKPPRTGFPKARVVPTPRPPILSTQ